MIFLHIYTRFRFPHQPIIKKKHKIIDQKKNDSLSLRKKNENYDITKLENSVNDSPGWNLIWN